jgi:Tol biopolymer transport system component
MTDRQKPSSYRGPSRSMRPRGPQRRLQPGQRSELVVFDLTQNQAEVIYETSELIEAPNWTPDGRWLVYNADGRVFRIAPDGQEGPFRINTVPVENLNNDHVLSPDGRTLYLSANDGHLYSVPVEGGTPQRVSNESEAGHSFRYYLHGVSPDGSLLSYVGLEKSPEGQVTTRICTIPSTGGPDRFLTDGACPVDGPEFSADGAWIYFNSEAQATCPGHAQVFRMRLDGSGLEVLTEGERVNWFPHCSPDGGQVLWLSYPPGTIGHPPDREVQLRLMNPDGSGQRTLVHFWGGQGTINVNSWAPDSQRFAYVAYPQE